MTLHACPRCKGEKQSFAFINRGPDITAHTAEFIACDLCEGSGTVDDATVRRVIAGRAHRDARVARQESLAACAKKLGVTVAALSAFETGRRALAGEE